MWQPTGSLTTLHVRAALMRQVREFFWARDVEEVETPLLGLTPVTDPYLETFTVEGLGETRYLQTSPEYAMKRLLAAGSGSIYQLGKAFRKEESGRQHLPEFTMLEWYHLDFTDLDLMNEVDDLLQLLLKTPKAARISYQDAFLKVLNLDPHQASLESLVQHVTEKIGEIPGLFSPDPEIYRDVCLQLLMSDCVERALMQAYHDRPVMVYEYPASQAALAQIKKTGTLSSTISVAARFEVFYQGMELGNGYFELQDVSAQRARFQGDLKRRAAMGLQPVPTDTRLLEAMAFGLPSCAGIAMGFDRLVMLAVGAQNIEEVVAFGKN